MQSSLIGHLTNGLPPSLPGRAAQLRMTIFAEDFFEPIPAEARKAAVLMLIYQKYGQEQIVFIRRSSRNPSDKHSGQISFPGGQYDFADGQLDRTALRETEEEIGIKSEAITLIGQLTPLYIPVSGFHVFPFLAYMDRGANFVLQASEVEAVLEVPLSHFLKNESLSTSTVSASYGRMKNFPCFIYEDQVIWGATAMMLNELIELL